MLSSEITNLSKQKSTKNSRVSKLKFERAVLDQSNHILASEMATSTPPSATGSHVPGTAAFDVNSETIDDEDQNPEHQLFLSSSSIIVLQPGSFNLYYGLVCIEDIVNENSWLNIYISV